MLFLTWFDLTGSILHCLHQIHQSKWKGSEDSIFRSYSDKLCFSKGTYGSLHDADYDAVDVVDSDGTIVEEPISQPSKATERKQYNLRSRREEDAEVGGHAATIEEVFISEIPVNQAMSGPDSDEWLQAIATDMRAILENNTWVLVKRPEHAKVIGSLIVLRNKFRPDGSLEKRKARLVA